MEDSDNISVPDNAERSASSGTRGTIVGEFSKKRKLWRADSIEQLLGRFSPGERLILYVLSGVLIVCAVVLALGVNNIATTVVPARGGELVEGEVGPARFINPVLALSQPDQDLTALVYSGLMRALPDGQIIPDLAQSYSISPDGTTYTFTLRPNATFQNGTPVTAADVLYTIQQVQDPAINSPQQANWDGVVVSSPNPETVVFTLPHAYAPFIQDTTLGILPKSLWENISDEEFPFSPLNMHPVGSGPYEVSNVTTDSTGAASRYDLVPFAQYTLGEPYLADISFVFYPDETSLIDALNSGSINAIADLDPSQLSSIKRSDLSLADVALPRDFAVFFNQNHSPFLADTSVREALTEAVNPQAIISSTLDGFGSVLTGPIPPNVSGTITPASPRTFIAPAATSTTTPAIASSTVAAAEAILQKGGWTFSTASGTWTKDKKTLSITLSTADEPELTAAADTIESDWEAIGVQVSVQVYPLSELETDVIRPRSYDALLFGEVVGPQLDLYAFWDSSQRNDPGLNLAMYTNSQADSILTQARATTNTAARDKLYNQFATLVVQSDPAIFLYAPDFLYVVPNDLKGLELGSMSTPSDRFDNVYQWYERTAHVWDIFAPSPSQQS